MTKYWQVRTLNGAYTELLTLFFKLLSTLNCISHPPCILQAPSQNLMADPYQILEQLIGSYTDS